MPFRTLRTMIPRRRDVGRHSGHGSRFGMGSKCGGVFLSVCGMFRVRILAVSRVVEKTSTMNKTRVGVTLRTFCTVAYVRCSGRRIREHAFVTHKPAISFRLFDDSQHPVAGCSAAGTGDRPSYSSLSWCTGHSAKEYYKFEQSRDNRNCQCDNERFLALEFNVFFVWTFRFKAAVGHIWLKDVCLL